MKGCEFAQLIGKDPRKNIYDCLSQNKCKYQLEFGNGFLCRKPFAENFLGEKIRFKDDKK